MDQQGTLNWGLPYMALVALCWTQGATEAEGKSEDPFPFHLPFLLLGLGGAVPTISPEAPITPATPAMYPIWLFLALLHSFSPSVFPCPLSSLFFIFLLILARSWHIQLNGIPLHPYYSAYPNNPNLQ